MEAHMYILYIITNSICLAVLYLVLIIIIIQLTYEPNVHTLKHMYGGGHKLGRITRLNNYNLYKVRFFVKVTFYFV